jgi:hypothetical protein
MNGRSLTMNYPKTNNLIKNEIDSTSTFLVIDIDLA